MADATVTTKCEGVIQLDSVMLTVSDGETYVSRLGTIYGVQQSINEDVSTGGTARLTSSFSGRTVTFQYPGMTDKKVFVTVFGRK